MKLIPCALLFGIAAAAAAAAATAEAPPYGPRGWRPSGRFFDPSGARSYGPPSVPRAYGPPTGTTTTEAPTTTVTTTTPRSREPTTPTSAPEEDFESNPPVVAVANSFAFNRPIYVYNGFPFYSGYTLVK